MASEQPSAAEPSATEAPAEAAKPVKKEDSFPVFVLKLVIIVVVFRSFLLAPFNIPSESMLPRLQDGDYLLASKWSYGYSKYSLPFSAPLIPDRLFASQPEQGDVVIFKQPPLNNIDYIKRVIGLPGDTIQMKEGVLHINGKAVPKVRVADFEVPVSPNTHCQVGFEAQNAKGEPVCRYPRFKETLPNGVSYYVLDLGQASPMNEFGIDADNTEPQIVPEGHLFLMGDNRDNSMDSRFPAVPEKGIGIVPQENLVGKAQVMMFSTDGGASWFKPWTWFTATRWSRIGGRI
jgi:signal peptidase I